MSVSKFAQQFGITFCQLDETDVQVYTEFGDGLAIGIVSDQYGNDVADRTYALSIQNGHFTTTSMTSATTVDDIIAFANKQVDANNPNNQFTFDEHGRKKVQGLVDYFPHLVQHFNSLARHQKRHHQSTFGSGRFSAG